MDVEVEKDDDGPKLLNPLERAVSVWHCVERISSGYRSPRLCIPTLTQDCSMSL